jgi:hypothetical protein
MTLPIKQVAQKIKKLSSPNVTGSPLKHEAFLIKYKILLSPPETLLIKHEALSNEM